MNTVVIGDVTYTKASTLAKKFRYTTDYIGQLCRAGKIDAQLVGRSWYVSEDSLELHSSKRIDAIRKDEITLQNSSLGKTPTTFVKISAPFSKQTKKMLQNTSRVSDVAVGYSGASYESDPVELLPILPDRLDSTVRQTLSVSSKIIEPTVEVEIKNFSNLTDKTAVTKIDTQNQARQVPVAEGKNIIKIKTQEHSNELIVPVLSSYSPSSALNTKKAFPKNDKKLVGIIENPKQVSFTPTAITATSSTKSKVPYRLLASSLILLALGVFFVTIMLDIEVRYEGVISSTTFSLNQTALVNFFK